MKSRGLDLSFFEANGILFHRPNLEERGIYRLIAEINHTLSGPVLLLLHVEIVLPSKIRNSFESGKRR